MNDDSTVIMGPGEAPRFEPASPLEVQYLGADGRPQSRRFEAGFVVGRDVECDVRVQIHGVSRRHVQVYSDCGAWFARDMNSANGTYLNGQAISHSLLFSPNVPRDAGGCRLRLGWDGPEVIVSVANESARRREPMNSVPPPPTKDVTSSNAPPHSRGGMTHVVSHYLGDGGGEVAGDRTLMIRRAVGQLRRRQARRYTVALGIVGALLIAALGIVIVQQLKLKGVRELAIELFYDMKSIELQIAGLEHELALTADERLRERLAGKRAELRAMTDRYRGFVSRSEIFGTSVSTEDQAILHMARVFGECELNVPPDFADEVKRYIAMWKGSSRLASALGHLRAEGYLPTILDALERQRLQPQFVYLALQESGFNERAVGPPTRYGHAKGMWQFIPTTATRYGLRTGPLSETNRYDPADERFDFEKATYAAATYLREIYQTEAQASGLLVMASYNWGEHRVRNLVNKLPQNPRERNFWKLLEQHNIPEETYDYVFYIFAAAVIGENPALFGFDFDNPLASG